MLLNFCPVASHQVFLQPETLQVKLLLVTVPSLMRALVQVPAPAPAARAPGTARMTPAPGTTQELH